MAEHSACPFNSKRKDIMFNIIIRMFFCFSFCFLIINNPAFATEKVEAFEFYMNVKDTNLEMGAMKVVESLNKYTRDGISVLNISDDADYSPDRASDAPLLLLNFKEFLQALQAKGYGSGKFERWGFIYVKGWCDEKDIVFYSPVIHGNKKVLFGFHLSHGQSLVTPLEIANKALKPGCD